MEIKRAFVIFLVALFRPQVVDSEVDESDVPAVKKKAKKKVDAKKAEDPKSKIKRKKKKIKFWGVTCCFYPEGKR